MTVIDIMDGISTALDAAFEGAYPIHADKDVIQELDEPCFFIAVLNPSQVPKLTGRYYRTNPFDVLYFPEETGDNKDTHLKAMQLMEVLEYITLANGDLLRGTGMNYEITDGVLHFRVNYNLFLRVEPDDITEMETLEYTGNVEDS